MRAWLLSLPLSACWLGQDVVDARKADLPLADEETDGRDTDPQIVDDTDLPLDTDPPADDTDRPPPEESDTIPEETDLLDCADVHIPSGISETELSASTEGASDDHVASCLGFTGGPDLAWSWDVPADGCYVFSTLGSDFDTVLYLLDGCGEELACNDDFLKQSANYESEVHAELIRGQAVSLVVDGYDAQSYGMVLLNMWRGEHLTYDVLSRVASGTLYSGSTRGQDDTLSFGAFSGCSDGGGGKDFLVEWTTPLAGYWHFWVEDADFDAVLSLHRMCDPYALVCDDVPSPLLPPGPDTIAEEVYMTLDEGETLILRIAGHQGLTGFAQAGAFELHAEALPEL